MALDLSKQRVAAALRSIERLQDRLLGRKRVHMLHIGKTGGTALKAALRRTSPSGTRLILHKHGTTLADVPAGEQCFFVVRDPVSRFTSGFLSRQRKGRPRYDIPWNSSETEAFTAFATPNELALALSSIDAAKRHEAEAAMKGIRHVRDHYAHWLRDQRYLRQRRSDILFVGSQERLDRDVALLSGLLDVTIALPVDETASHRNSTQADGRLDAVAVANLKHWYRDDYDFLRILRVWFPDLPDYDAKQT